MSPVGVVADSYFGSELSIDNDTLVYQPITSTTRDQAGYAGFSLKDSNTAGLTTTPNLGVSGNVLMRGNLGAKEVVKPTNNTTVGIDWRLGNNQRIIMSGSGTRTVTFNNAPDGPTTLTLVLQHHGSFTDFTWDSKIIWPLGQKPVLSSNIAGGVDIINLFFDGTRYFGVRGFGTL